MTFNFKYEDAGEIRTLSVGVKETGIHFNRSEAAIASTWRTYLRLVTHGDESYYMLENVNYSYAYTELSRFSNTAFKNNILSKIDWTDESCQLVAVSGMHNFGRNEAGNYYQEITYGDGGSCYLQFFIWTNPETQQSYVANAGFSGFKPHGTNGWIALASNAQSNLIDDLAHTVRPNIMLLKATMTDDDATSPNYNQDFDVIIIVRKVYSGATEQNHIMIADERLFTGARRNDPSKSTTKGNTPNGFRGGRDDHSDSDTVSTIGTGLDTAFVNTGSHGVRLYRINAASSGVGVPSQYDDLYNCFWSENFWDKYRNAKWSPLSGVISLHMMPCDPTDAEGRPATFTTNQQIYIAGQELSYVYEPGPPAVEIHAHGDVPDHSKAQIFTKTFHPLEYAHSFLDWGANTRARLRLPFIGVVPVEISKIMEGGLFAKYNIDFLTGNCLVQVYTVPSKDVMGEEGDWDEDYGGCVCLIAEYSGNCAQKLNFAGNDYGGNYAAGYVGGIASTALSQEREGVENFVNHMGYSIIGGYLDYRIRSKHHIYNIPATANVSTMGMMIPALIIDRPIDITPLDENGDATVFESFNGRPAASGGQVKDYKGMDTGEGIFIKGILHADTLYATEDEKRQIESAFAKGVYL